MFGGLHSSRWYCLRIRTAYLESSRNFSLLILRGRTRIISVAITPVLGPQWDHHDPKPVSPHCFLFMSFCCCCIRVQGPSSPKLRPYPSHKMLIPVKLSAVLSAYPLPEHDQFMSRLLQHERSATIVGIQSPDAKINS